MQTTFLAPVLLTLVVLAGCATNPSVVSTSARAAVIDEATLQQLRTLGDANIDAIAASYGVPAEVLVAIWGLEVRLQ